MKYQEATDNPDQYVSDVKFVNFDIIYNDIHKTVTNTEEYQTIKITSTDTTKNLSFS